jgi:hypothetical protein
VHTRASARSREIVITTVPLLTKELATTYPFLKTDFATGGVLDGKEVYEFMPRTSRDVPEYLTSSAPFLRTRR